MLRLADWIYEAGIGEVRAALVEDGRIVEAHIELPGLRAGTVAEARLTSILISGRRGVATLRDGTEILVEPLFQVTEGAAIRVEIVREAIPEVGALKRAKGRITDLELVDGPDLASRIGAHRTNPPYGADLLEESGWTECLEEARRGIVAFLGGKLRFAFTPAMTLIDVDGDILPYELALAGAAASAKGIRRFNITGNIGIDLPTVAGKGERQAIAAAVDAQLPQPFERTAVNGFGFLQIIRPRVRTSLCDTLLHDPVGTAARALLRTAQRSSIIGKSEIVAAPQVIATISCQSDWVEQLSQTLGGTVSLRERPELGIYEGSIHRIG